MSENRLTIAKWALPADGQASFLAISGGLDSVTLLHLLLQNHIRPTLLHVNYQLRGEESQKDEAFVRNLARQYDLPVLVKRINLKQILQKHPQNLQALARSVRYDFFNKHLEEHSICYTAHHANDQVETFWMRLMKGSRQIDLAGIPPKRGPFTRPLLSYSKDELRVYAHLQKLEWREDQSNFSTDYFRNLLRNEWLPLMEKSAPNILQDSLTLCRAISQTNKLQQDQLKTIFEQIENQQFIAKSDWDQLNALSRELLFRHLTWPLTYQKEFEKLLQANRSSTSVLESKNLTLVKELSGISWHLGGQTHTFPKLKVEQVKQLPEEFSKEVIYLDEAQLVGKPRIRKWRHGDKIESLGMIGTQLISDILKDAKVSLVKKDQVAVVEDEAGILWCPSFKVSRRALATEKSESIIKLTLKH